MPLLIAVAALSVAMSLADDTKLTISKITETRIAKVTPDQGTKFVITGDVPSLKVSLVLPLPDKATLVSIEEPKTIKATDDTGKDLTKVEKRFGGGIEYWSSLFSNDTEKGKLTLQLLPADRKASTFDLSLTAEASISTGQTTVELKQEKGWTKLDAAVFGEGAEYRVTRTDGKVNVDVRPEMIRDRVQKMSFKGKTKMEESDGMMWVSGATTYMFSNGVEDEAKLVIFARTGFQKMTVSVDAKGLKLP